MSNLSPDSNTSELGKSKESTDKPVEETEQSNNGNVRQSSRQQDKGKTELFEKTLETQSLYHEGVNREIDDQENSPTYERLIKLCDELSLSIKQLHENYDVYKNSVEHVPRDTNKDIDRITADNDSLIEKVNVMMSNISVRPPSTHTQASSIYSGSVRSGYSRSSQSTTSSKLRMKAQEAKAAKEAKRVQLQALITQEEQEQQLAALRVQQEEELARKKREIERAKLQAEIAAEQTRQDILEQAAEEASPRWTLMRPSTTHHEQLENSIQESEPRDHHQILAQYHVEEATPSPRQLQTNKGDIADRQTQNRTANQAMQHLEAEGYKPREPRDNPEKEAHSHGTPTHSSDQALLAGAILSAIDHSVGHPKLEAPKPYIYTGKLTDYPDWRVAINRFIRDKQGQPADKLALLRSYLSPDHHSLINAYCTMGTESAWNEALEALDEEFGNQFQIAKAYKQELQKWPRISANDGLELKKYVGFLKQCASAMEKIETLKDLNSLTEQQRIIKKLPVHLERKWINETTKHYEQYGNWPRLWDLCKLLQYEVKVACNPLNDNMTVNDNSNASNTRTTNARANKIRTPGTRPTASHSFSTKTENRKRKFCVNCKRENHYTSDCGYISRMDERTKQKFISDNNLCFYCLNPGHGFRECKTPVRCQVSGCEETHATVNHNKVKGASTQPQRKDRPNTGERRQTEKQTPNVSSTTSKKQPENKPPPTQRSDQTVQPQLSDQTSACHSIRSSEEIMSMFIMPVHVTYGKGCSEVTTYALIDSMSDRSFISQDLVEKLKVPSTEKKENTMTLYTMAQMTEMNYKEISGLKIRGYGESYTVNLPLMTTTSNEIPINRGHIPTRRTADQWKHLRCISDKLPPSMDIDVGILLGANCNPAHVPLEVIANSPEEPYAKRTVLGWSISGSHHVDPQQTNKCYNHRIITKSIQDDRLSRKTVSFASELSTPSSQQILSILESDFQPTKEDMGLSIEDRIFTAIMTDNIYQDSSGHITMPLPFRHKPKGFGALSRKTAEHRFKLLLQRFQTNPEYEQKYKEFMTNIIDHGDAELVHEDDPNSWYIPHFGVFHPKKPQKIRVVFDCAAKVGGKALNDYLLQGPDMMNSMLGILMRFRSKRIAISCDIERMFHQFHVTPQDRDYLRFLWLDNSGQIATFRMKVHLFGAKSSPACATFGLRYLATLYGNNSSAQKFIATNFYVDDGLISTETIHEATSLVKEVSSLCQKGRVRLHKFVSNSIELLTAIPESERNDQNNTNLIKTDEAMHRTLGVQWNTLSDLIQYKPQLPSKTLTRRGILSMIASIFDPLGLISPVVITGKLLLQQCCRNKLGWDDELPPDITNQWTSWTESMKKIITLDFPRCYKPIDFGEATRAELHSFSDASNKAYGAAIYLRLINKLGETSVNLVYAKARVAPTNIVSIPRLELQAAVLSTVLSEFVRKELTDYKIDRTYYYTDSQIVLGYLSNEIKRFQVFVANRVQKIRNHSSTEDWFYVPTKLNPADHASRGLPADQVRDSLWINGPAFLSEETLQLPAQQNQLSLKELKEQTDDVKTTASANVVKTSMQTSILDRLNNISDWTKIVSLVTTLEQYKRFLCKRHLQQLEMKPKLEAQQYAEKTVIKVLQARHLAEEISLLKQGKTINKSSVLYKLCPFLDDDGIVRIGGRLEHSQYLEFKEKHPIALPKSHITSTIIQHFHDKTGHQGRRSTLGQLRLHGYWIIGGHALISSTINKCITCKRLRARPQGQKMAPLPSKRTEATPPFTYVGCDIFGPFIVRDRRSNLKRYGAIFTCMASKAIHIEIVDDMTTDSFLNALRCIIAIRGPIRQLHTDCGTNFIGAANELHKQLEVNNSFTTFASKKNVEFVTNVPYASHMGGIWERQIRSIRSVMNGLLKGHNARLDSTSLRTLFYEIMAIINCRPLTGTDDGLPLHPNMLLTLKSSLVLPPPGDFDETDIYSRKRWRRVQGMASEFWRRWKTEYIQTLQERQKWINQKPNLKVNDIVLLQDANLPRNDWPLARITDVMTSKDDLVRKVIVVLADRNLNQDGERRNEQLSFERPAHKVVLIYRPEDTTSK